jgi:hypothetical protein
MNPRARRPPPRAHSFRVLSSLSGPSWSWHGRAVRLGARTVIRCHTPEGRGYGPAGQAIVFCHGIWADGSCFSKVIPPLPAEGYEVICAQYGLNTNVEDVAAAVRYFGTSATRSSWSATPTAERSSPPRAPMTASPGSFTSRNWGRMRPRPRRASRTSSRSRRPSPKPW